MYGSASLNDKMLGHVAPVRVREGQRVLFRLLNASATENVTLALAGHRMTVVALDGNPVPAQRTQALESEVGWVRALLDAFRARRTFDESKAEGAQIEDLKAWRPDLRDFVVEVAKQHEDPRAAPPLQSVRPQ